MDHDDDMNGDDYPYDDYDDELAYENRHRLPIK